MQWSQNLCRLCGHISETCHNIHDTQNHIEVKLQRYLNMKALKNDYKPNQICDQCFGKLNEVSAYIDMCYETNTKYETIYRASQEEPFKPNNVELQSKQDRAGKDNKTVVNKSTTKAMPPVTLINPPNCKIKTTNSSIKIEQVRTDTFDDNFPGPVSKIRAVNHISAKKRITTMKKIKNGTLQCPVCSKKCKLADFCPFKCDICQRRFKTGHNLKQHLNAHLKMRFKCCLCSREYKHKHFLVNHLKKRHNTCFFCKTKFQSCELLIKHLKICEHKK